MCGRFALSHAWDEIARIMSIERDVFPERDPSPRYNIAPTQPIMTIIADGGGKRVPLLVRWGLVPSWVKDPASFTLLINARGETAAEKPSFRNAMNHRRVLIPASGFYEWRRREGRSQPYWVQAKDGGLIAFAGLMETYADPNGSEIDTGCIVTTEANSSFAAIHHRLPVIIGEKDFEAWLDCANGRPNHVEHLLRPVNDDFLQALPVSAAVNKVSNSGAEIQETVEAEPTDEPPEQLGLFS
jgi:putative SOS response-associated peptidase YedK